MNTFTVNYIDVHAETIGTEKETILEILKKGRDQGHHERLAEHVTCAAIYDFSFFTTIQNSRQRFCSNVSVVIAIAPSFSTDVYASEDDYGVTYSRKTNLEYHLIFVKDPSPRVLFHELIHALVGPEFSFTSNGACGVLFDWLYDNNEFLRALINCAQKIALQFITFKEDRKENDVCRLESSH